MRRIGGLVAVAATALALAACSGGSTPTAAPASPSSAPAVASELAPDVRADVSERLLRKPEWTGATSVAATQLYAPAEAAALDPDPATEGERLRQLGLVAVAAAHVRVPGTQDAVTSVFRFASASGAKGMVARLAATKGTTPFAVPGMPGAVGYQVVNRAGTVLASNITFAVGQYVYTVGCVPTGAHPMTNAQLREVATTWYARVA